MTAEVANPRSEIVTQLKYVNPYSNATGKLNEYCDTATEVLNSIMVHITHKLQNNIPTSLRGPLLFITDFAIKSSVILAILFILGLIAYETSFSIFRILGLIPPHHLKLIKKKKEVLAKEMEETTPDERKHTEVLMTQMLELNKAINQGGQWVWFSSSFVFIGRVLLDDIDFWTSVRWAFAEVFVVCCVLPIAASFIVRFVAPKAHLSTAWLGGADGEIPGPMPPPSETQKDQFHSRGARRDAAPRERQGYRFALRNQPADEGDYLYETNRARYSKRVAKANGTWGLL